MKTSSAFPILIGSAGLSFFFSMAMAGNIAIRNSIGAVAWGGLALVFLAVAVLAATALMDDVDL